VSWLFGILLAILEGRSRPKFIFHERGWILRKSPTYPILVRSASKIGTIVGVSKHVVERANALGIPVAKTTEVPNAIDTDYFRPNTSLGREFRQEAGIPPGSFVIGFAGRIDKVKGWQTLLSAFGIVAEDRSMRLLISGIGPQAAQLKSLISAHRHNQKILYIGYQREMLHFYNALDVCVVPSILEPFGRVQLEAQACGIPVICSDIPGINETVSARNAMMVPVGDPKALAEAIIALHQNKDICLRYQKAGLENSQKYGLDQYLSRIEQLYLHEVRST
jgi:glycosyltransferase involved in cell wall biosynthesis